MAPTLTWLDSFEHQQAAAVFYGTNLGVYDTLTGGPGMSFVTGRRAGSHALQIAQNGVAAGRAAKVIPAGNRVLVESFYFKCSAKPSVDSAFWNGTSFANSSISIQAGTGFMLIKAVAAGTPVTVSTDFTDGVWRRIDLKWDTSASPYKLDVSIDGAAQTQCSSGSTAADITAAGLGSSSAAHTLTAVYQDWVRSVTSGDHPIGAHRCVALIPNADGSHSWASTNMGDSTGGRASSITDLNTMVDDFATGAANTTDYIAYTNTTATSTEYAEILFPDVASGLTVWGARAVAAIFSATTTANSATTRVVNGAGATVLDVWTGDMSDTSLRHNAGMVPSITSDTLLNALKFRVGFPTDSNPAPRWSALMIDYATLDGTTTNQAVAATTTATAVITAVKKGVAAIAATSALAVGRVLNTGKVVAAATTLTLGRALQTGKLVVATVTGTIVLAKTKVSLAAIAATTTLTAALTASKVIRQAVAAAVTLTVAIVTAKVKLQAVAATTALTAAISRNVGKVVSAATTLTAVLTRRIGHTVAAATTLTVALLRRVPQTIAATVTLTASLIRRVGKAIAASTAVTAALSFLKVALKAIAATTTLTVTIPLKVGKLVTAATTVTAAITRRLTKLQAIAATTALAAVLARKVGKQISGVITLGVALTRRTGKLVAAGATLTVGLVKKVAKRIAASSPVTAVVSAVFQTAAQQVIAVTSSLTVVIHRRTAKTVAAALTLTVAIGRAIGHVLTVAAGAAFNVVIVRGVGKLLAVGMTVGTGITRGLSKTVAVLVTVGAALRRVSSNLAHGFGLVDPFEAEGEDALTADTDAATFDAETDDELLVDVTAGDGWDADTGEGW